LSKLAAGWPASRAVEIWNRFAGVAKSLMPTFQLDAATGPAKFIPTGPREILRLYKNGIAAETQ